jgi:DNA polymerase I-like protein with 3'-5' exonuclease and polymerase domains/phage/plasmid-associated DNA primase
MEIALMVEHHPTSGNLASAEGDAADGVNPGRVVDPATEIRAALDIARDLAAAGIPVFVAPPNPEKKIGFDLPADWERTRPDPAVLDRWQPGWAVGAVMGCGLDLIDIDPRNGGNLTMMNGSRPAHYAIAATPSGGMHAFIASTGSGSRDNIFPGIDVKSGMADGSGRGFAFLAPTMRPSKVTGEPAAYRWLQPPDIERVAAVVRGEAEDASGRALAARIRELKSEGVAKIGGPDWWREFVLSREPQSQAAAERAITEKLTDITTWNQGVPDGFRTVLLRAAMTLGGYVGGGYLDEDEARRRLEEATAQVWGTPDDDDRLWVTQGLTDGAAAPFYVYTAADELAFSEVAQAQRAREGDGPNAPPPWNVYTALGTEPFDPGMDSTDQGLAEQVAARIYPALRFAVDAGTWIERRRESWREREDMSDWAISTVARLMPLGDPDLPSKKADYTQQHWRHVRRAKFMDSGGSGKVSKKLRAIVRGADHPLAVELADLDADPEVLWAGGHAWDLRASLERPVLAAETRGVSEDQPHLHTAACEPLVRPTPAWDRFVAAVLPDPERRAWAMRVLAIALAGYPDAALPVLYGPERTGKTALVQLIVRVLGTYGHAADPRLLAGADNAHASVVYALKGRRLSFIDEGPRRGNLATERLKQLTGGASLTGNAMRANPVTFLPTHTLVMTTNDEPPITDPALRARMRIILCDGDKAEVRAARQALTEAVWHDEAPGVLAKLMTECAHWIADPDTAGNDRAPVDLRAAVDEMIASQNPIGEWVEMCTVPSHPGTSGAELYRRFATWYDGQAAYRRIPMPGKTIFGRTLGELGYPVIEGQGPKQNQKFRPLSVLNGPGMPAPWEPGGSGGGLPVPTPAPTPADTSGPKVSETGNPSSSPLFSSSSDTSDTSHTTTSSNTHTTTPNGVDTQKTQGNRERVSGCRSVDLENSAPPATIPVPPPAGPSVGSSAAGHEKVTTSDKSTEIIDPLLSVDIDPEAAARAERNRVTREAARLADERKISKAEARKLLKETERAEAIAAASGGTYELPIAVGRNRVIVSVSVEDAAAQVRAAITRSGALTVDVETSGYPVGHRDYELRSVQLGDEHVAVVLDPVVHDELIRALLAEAPKLHAHSATADLVPLEHAGLVDAEAAWAKMFDTVLPAKLADPASTGSDPGLKQLAGVVLGADAVSPAAEEARKAVFKAGRWLEDTKVTTPRERSGWAQIDTRSAAMAFYAAADVLDDAAIARRLPEIPGELMERERLAQRMTARVTHRGVRLDAERIREMGAKHTALRAEEGAKVREMLGVANPSSDKQIAVALQGRGAPLPMTAAGNPSVKEEVLQKLIVRPGVDPAIVAAAKTVLEYRHHDTVLGTFLEPYRVLCELGDGRARPTVYTLGTNTGRMSCVRPNLQQLPREGGIRACLIADPGQLMIGADFSGVEIRVAAALSQDPTLLRLLAEGRDLHAEVAAMVWGESAGKAERYIAKRIVFGRLYGGGVPTLAGQAGVSESICQSAVDSLDTITPVLAEWSHAVRQAVKQGNTQYPSYSGRIIHLPREFPHKAPNYLIQGTAREILIDALVRWSQTKWGACTLLPVHDELDVFVPAEDAEEATRTLIECMQTEIHGVKIVAEASTPSPFWADSV